LYAPAIVRRSDVRAIVSGEPPRSLYKPYNAPVALTIGQLLRIPGLDLRPVAGDGGRASAIRWVHVSELDDPTPWLKGGELLLTTGLALSKLPARQRTYVNRLVQAGLCGLGFGTGFTYRRVPKGVVDAADRAGFPVFEVPYEVPFIAITETVFTRLVAEQYDVLSRSLDAEHALTRAVLEGLGVGGVVSALCQATGGWALVLDLHGATVAWAPESGRRHARAVWQALQDHRSEGLRFSLSLVDRGNHISAQPVVAQGRVEAFLATGKREAPTQFDRIVSSHALSLLAIELVKARAVSDAERRLKGDVLDRLLMGSMGDREARMALDRLGFDLSRPVAAVVLSGPGSLDDLAEAWEESLSRRDAPFLCSVREDAVLSLLQPSAPGFLAELRSALVDGAGPHVQAGAGSLVPFGQLAQGVREARYALQVCRTEGRPFAEFSDLGTYQLLLSLQDPDALRAFAASILEPLDRYDRAHGGELVQSLRAFLDRNARWEAAAAHLYVHRHTLRYRMRKVEQLTGRDLSSARDRMEFFLALRASELLSSADWPSAPGSNGPRPRTRGQTDAPR
jgi:purine catabolism regulator